MKQNTNNRKKHIYIYIYICSPPPPPPHDPHIWPREGWFLGGAGLQTPDPGQKKSGVRGRGTPDFFWKSGVRGPGTPDFFWKSGVWSPRPRYSRFFLEIWSLESGASVLQNLESGARYSRFFLEIWSLESGARVLQIFWKSGVWSPGPCSPYERLGITV